MKPAQRFAAIFGAFYLITGIMGFVPALISTPGALPEASANLGVITGYGHLMGLFPVNIVHNIIHIVVGLLGIAASTSLDTSRLYSGQLGIWFGVLAILGLIPVANTLFGLVPLYGYDVILHGATSLLGIYFGFIATPDLRQVLERETSEASSNAPNPN